MIFGYLTLMQAVNLHNESSHTHAHGVEYVICDVIVSTILKLLSTSMIQLSSVLFKSYLSQI